MAIQINDITVIDDDGNFSSVGILTSGSGNTLINIDESANFTVGTGVTFEGISGNISIAGTFTSSSVSIPL